MDLGVSIPLSLGGVLSLLLPEEADTDPSSIALLGPVVLPLRVCFAYCEDFELPALRGVLPSLISTTGTVPGHTGFPSLALLGPEVSGGKPAGRRTCGDEGAPAAELAVRSEVESVVNPNEESASCTAGAASMDESVTLEVLLILSDSECFSKLGGYTAADLPLG